MKNTITKKDVFANIKYIFFAALIFPAFLLPAQENNYWCQHYGANSTLLGGAVVSTYNDNGAMFYNPATMAFKDSSNLSVSANIYKLERLTVNNALGNGVDIVNYNYGIVPQLLSGSWQLSPKTEIGFIMITRNDVDFAFNQAYKDNYLLIPTYSVPDTARYYDYVANFEGRTRIMEDWGGASFSYRINDHFAVGITNFLCYRFQRYSRALDITALGVYDTLARYNAKLNYAQTVLYDNFNDVVKLGACFNSEHIDVGTAVTLPSIRLIGVGRATSQWYFSNFTAYVNEVALVFDKERDLDITYKTPLSVSAGVGLKFSKTKLFLSGEYFQPISTYDLYVPISPTSSKSKKAVQFNSEYALGVKKFADQVINFGAGIEQVLTSKVKLQVGFNSDFTAVKSENTRSDYNDITYSYIDIWHGAVGLKIKNKKNFITIGVSACYGTLKDQSQWANLTNPVDVEGSTLAGYPEPTVTYTYSRIGIVFGVTY